VPHNKHRANPRREVRTNKCAENRWPVGGSTKQAARRAK
jgi:hypothetical protein